MTNVEGDTERLNELRSYLTEHMCFYDENDLYSSVEKCLLPGKFRDIEQRVRDVEVYEDDTWILTYPRSGTTWSRAMLWLIANGLDYSGNEKDLFLRFPLLEMDMFPNHHAALEESVNCKFGDTIEYIKKNEKATIYMESSAIAPVAFTAAGEETKVTYGDYWHRLASFRSLYEKPYVLNITFEGMKQDYMSVLKKTAAFFGKNYTDNELKKLESYLSFSNMKTNKSLNFQGLIDKMQDVHKRSVSDSEFMRKGVVGGHKNEMSEETITEFDEWSFEMKKKLNLIDDKKIP